MSKGIAVPYVIALILGIIVVGVIGYWFFVLGGQGGGAGVSAACNAKLVSYCTQWSLNGYTTMPNNQEFTAANPDCALNTAPFSDTILVDECKSVLGQSTAPPR
jgi:hypothetical protein